MQTNLKMNLMSTITHFHKNIYHFIYGPYEGKIIDIKYRGFVNYMLANISVIVFTSLSYKTDSNLNDKLLLFYSLVIPVTSIVLARKWYYSVAITILVLQFFQVCSSYLIFQSTDSATIYGFVLTLFAISSAIAFCVSWRYSIFFFILSFVVPFLEQELERKGYFNNNAIVPLDELSTYFLTCIFVAIAIISVLSNSYYLEKRIKMLEKEKKFSLNLQDKIKRQAEKLEKIVQQKKQNLNRANRILEIKSKDLNNQTKAYKKINNQILAAEKASFVSLLGSGIALEINNPLNYIQSSINILNEKIFHKGRKLSKKKKEDLEKLFTWLNKGTSLISEITHNIERQIENKSSTSNVLNVHHEIDFAVNLALYESSSNITINKAYIEKDIFIYSTQTTFNQIIVNLLKNAIRALNKNKKIIDIITTIEGKNVLIEIKDNGIGMTKEVQDKIFSPYFTTKKTGSGIGLFLVKNMLKDISGEISVLSKKNKGTSFFIKIPMRNI